MLFAAGQAEPVNFLYTSDELGGIQRLIEREDIAGVQVVYYWKDLEPAKDKYDFSRIEKDLAFLGRLNKKLFVQVQDRFFMPEARHVPGYLLEDPQYGGGLAPQADNPGEGLPAGSGWVTQHWNPAVRLRFQKLLKALGEKFDGRVYGLNLPETSADIDAKTDKTGFTCDKYFNAELENLKAAKSAFKRSYVVQYANFWPCEWENDHNYMGRTFEFAAKNGIGLGGPDIVPGKKAQMKNSYPFFNRYKGKLPLVAMAVQEPTLTYTDPKTGKPFTKEEFVDFAGNYLGAGIIFWSVDAPWLAGYTVSSGTLEGALYKIAQPLKWNKKLLIIARGARGKGRPLTADFKIEGTYVEELLARGWLVAQSSYRRNGIFVTDGLADIKALYDLTVKTYGRPERAYIEGSSMGGNIAVLLAEEPRGAYDGALAVGAALTCDDDGTASEKNLDSFRKHSFRPNIPVLFYSNVNELERVAEYAALASSGTANAAVWTSPRRGHCNINDAEKLKALQALVDWAEGGRRPAEGEVAAIAFKAGK